MGTEKRWTGPVSPLILALEVVSGLGMLILGIAGVAVMLLGDQERGIKILVAAACCLIGLVAGVLIEQKGR